MAKKRKRNKKRSEQKKSNPLLDAQSNFLQSLTEDERENFFSSVLPAERRAELWMQQADLGQTLVNQYAWATPDHRALNILKQFSPLVEIGCGSNAYWCRIMADAGIDVVGYDASLQQGGKTNSGDNTTDQAVKKDGPGRFVARQGGPEVLSTKEIRNANRTLFLCYPDENDLEPEEGDNEDPQSLGAACLEQYEGQYIIHVGELYGDTPSLDQAPWGRSSSAEFQQRLSAEFHCVLKAGLTNWLHVRDTISIWRRTELCSIVFAAEEDGEDDEEVEYKHIPVKERLPVDLAAPCMKHLLINTETSAGMNHLAPSLFVARGKRISSSNREDEKIEKQTQRGHHGAPASVEDAQLVSKDFVSPW